MPSLDVLEGLAMSDQVVALFCGAGGLSLGFANAGMAPRFAAEIDPFACATYSENQCAQAHRLDLGASDSAPIFRLLETHRDCLAVVGGPPCQGFSTAGSRRSDDPRNRLVFSYLKIVDFLRPRWFLFENVEGILTAEGGEAVYSLLSCFIERGYTVRLEKVNFAAYGLPQSRKRVLIIGNRLGMPFTLPRETHSFMSGKHNSCRPLPAGPSIVDAIGDLPQPSAVEFQVQYRFPAHSSYASSMRKNNPSNAVTHHFSPPADYSLFHLLRPGQTMRDLPEEHWHPSFRRRANRRVKDGTPTERRGGAPSGIKRLFGDRSSLTITSAASREFIHPSEHRPLTLREAARLQSFPDWFNFKGNASSIATQIGNAVPPLVGEVFAKDIALFDGAFGGGKSVVSVRPGLLGYRLTDANGQSPALRRTEQLLRQLPIVGKESERLLWHEDAITV